MISLATVLEELGLTPADDPASPADARRDRILTRMIAAATATLGRELGYYLGPPQLVTEVKRGGVALIVLNDPPTVGESIDAPVIRSRWGIADAWEAVETTDYLVDGAALRHSSAWPGGVSSIEVAYTRGYEPDTGPPELMELVLEMVTGKWVASQDDLALKSESIGDYSYSNFGMAELAAATGDWEGFARAWRRQLV